MVAIALLALVTTSLTQVTVDGMRIEGEADRRLEASLLADRVLAELESQAFQGTAPEIGKDVQEEAGYQITLEARPLDLDRLGLIPPPSPGEPPPAALVGTPGLGSAPPLLQIEVVVAWQEGVHELSVRRTTFSFDAASAGAGITGASDNGPDPLTRGDERRRP